MPGRIPMFIFSAVVMARIKSYFAATTLVLCAALPFSAAAQNNDTKVIVIPMAGDEASCTWRYSGSIELTGNFGQVISYCQPDEIVISGGYAYSVFNTTKDCRVVTDIAIKKDFWPNDGWRVYWRGTSTNQCDGLKVYTSALCCKE